MPELRDSEESRGQAQERFGLVRQSRENSEGYGKVERVGQVPKTGGFGWIIGWYGSEEKISDFRREQAKNAEKCLNEALDIYASYELAKSEDRHTKASVRLEEVGSKLWTSFYSITEAGVNRELKDFRSLKKARAERLELPEKYYEMAEEFRDYFHSGGIKERDYEKLEKAFNALTGFLKERLEKMKSEKKK